jgi:hypothetical protein
MPTLKNPKNAKHAPSSWSALARELGVSRQSFVRWRAMPSAPLQPDPKLWALFIESNSLGSDGSSTLKALRAELLRSQIKRENRRYQIEGRELIALKDSIAAASQARTLWQQAIRSKLEHQTAARLVGKNVDEIHLEMRLIHDELIEEINAAWDKAAIEDPAVLED